MSRALEAGFVALEAAARRSTAAAVKQGARRYIRGEQAMAAILPGIAELPPEDVVPALREAADAARESLRLGRWYASTSRALAARSALLAARWWRRFGPGADRRAA